MKKLMVVVCVMLIIGGGGYAAWETGVASRVWNGASATIARVFGRETAQTGPSVAAVLGTSPVPQSASAAPAASIQPAQRQVQLNLPPTVSAAMPVPVERSGKRESVAPMVASQDGIPRLAIADIASSSSSPSSPVPAVAQSVQPDLRPVSSAQIQAQLQAQGQQAALQKQMQQQQINQAQNTSIRPTAQTTASTGSGSDMAPIPVLSDAKAQIRVVDQMLASEPAEALRRINDLLATRLEPDDAAEAGYRRGYAARMLRDEATAESAWKDTAERFPSLRGGRFSAMALADTWYHRYAGDRPQISYWDDIQSMYSRVLGMDDAPFLPDNIKAAIKVKLNKINDMVLFGTAPTKLARYHKVENGEYLTTIGNKYRVDYESISRINGINPNRIRVGMDLKLVVGDVAIVVRKNEREPEKGPMLTWFLDGRWAREYPACVGSGNKTPAGNYHLTLKERDPSWTNPANGQLLPNSHPENILGSRWMAMNGMNTQGLGIHGTTVYDSIPGYTSAGCVRLLNKDVEELYSYARLDARVTVLD